MGNFLVHASLESEQSLGEANFGEERLFGNAIRPFRSHQQRYSAEHEPLQLLMTAVREDAIASFFRPAGCVARRPNARTFWRLSSGCSRTSPSWRFRCLTFATVLRSIRVSSGDDFANGNVTYCVLRPPGPRFGNH